MAVPLVRSPEASDTELVQAARAGNRVAFGTLYERYRAMVHGILLSHVRYGEAEDLMQTVFVQAMQRMEALRETAAFGGWLSMIARNLAKDHHRGRRNLVEVEKADEVCRNATPTYEAEEAIAAIRRLPEAYRETLILRLVEGMTGPEIAARTGLTPESVRVNLCRGMKLLREELKGKSNHE
ncbi:RNA polymerase sigma factor [Bryobacter aggregatus]|uniref:RNA polymerase sigma factor n=1 Tax=Bryobacter aggregatus TaxID=360054 RepID=UPI001EE356F1|nr:sigma-70 family RNA polymerase sigma factor [Bryobacter aggregatus]